MAKQSLVLLPLLVAAVLAQETVTVTAEGETTGPANWPSDWQSISWWGAEPSTTLSSEVGPISPHRSETPATTSFTGIGAYTWTSSSIASPTSYPNGTSSSLPTPTNGTLPACKKIQYDFPAGSGSNTERAEAVKEAYLYAWDAYTKYAINNANGTDELLPLTLSGINDWFGWGVTVVDAIDTAVVMGLTDVVEQQLAYIQKIDFDTTAYGVSGIKNAG
jgi:mannosyl-oligosaccharide alpha-1,2-mannosidase